MIKKITLFLGLAACTIAPIATTISCGTSIQGVTPITFNEGEIVYNSTTKTFTINRTITTKGRDDWDEAPESEFISYARDVLGWILGLFNNSIVITNYRQAQILVINGGTPFNVTNMFGLNYTSLYDWYEAEVEEWKTIWNSSSQEDREEVQEFKSYGCDTPEKAALISIYETLNPIEVLN